MAIHITGQGLSVRGLLLLLASFILLGGCSTIHSSFESTARPHLAAQPYPRAPQRAWRLSEKASLLVLAPVMAEKNIRLVSISQQQLQLALAQVFARAQSVASSDPGTILSADLEYHYYVLPEILQHVNRANSVPEFLFANFKNGIGRDYLQVKLLLYDALNDELLDTTVITVYAPSLSLGQQPVAKLFFKAFNQYAVTLSSMAQP